MGKFTIAMAIFNSFLYCLLTLSLWIVIYISCWDDRSIYVPATAKTLTLSGRNDRTPKNSSTMLGLFIYLNILAYWSFIFSFNITEKFAQNSGTIVSHFPNFNFPGSMETWLTVNHKSSGFPSRTVAGAEEFYSQGLLWSVVGSDHSLKTEWLGRRNLRWKIGDLSD